MYTNNYKSIVLAIFYSQKEWHFLVNRCIKPFIKELVEQNEVERFYLFVEKNKGEHISLVLLSSSLQEINHDYVRNRIRTFIQDFPSKDLSVAARPFPLQTFFMDYPNNSVCSLPQFAIKFLQEIKSHPNRSQIRYNVSKSISEAFIQDEFTIEALYSFVIYIQLGVIKAYYPDMDNPDLVLERLRNAFPVHFDNEREEEESDDAEFANRFKLLFEHNRDLLEEITGEIWSGNSSSSLSWFTTWESDCISMASKIGFEEHYFQALAIVFNHLGFPSNAMMTQFTLNLISNSLGVSA